MRNILLTSCSGYSDSKYNVDCFCCPQCLSDNKGKPLHLKKLHVYSVKKTEIIQDTFNLKASSYTLVFMALENTMQAAKGKKQLF